MSRKFRICGAMVIVLFGVTSGFLVVKDRHEHQAVEQTIQTYQKNLRTQNFYKILIINNKNSHQVEQTAQKYRQMFSVFGAKKIKMRHLKIVRTKVGYHFQYNLEMITKIGKIHMDKVTGKIRKVRGKYQITNAKQILIPHVNGDRDILEIQVNYAKRGMIRSKDGKTLAFDTTKEMVGISPAKLNSSKHRDAQLARIAAEYHISLASLQTRLDQFTTVDQSSFLPLQRLTKVKVPKVAGLVVRQRCLRKYKNSSQRDLLGTVSSVSDAEMNRDPTLNQLDRTGRSGIEKRYNARLAGTDGGQLYFKNPNGDIVYQLNNKVVNGQNIKLSEVMK